MPNSSSSPAVNERLLSIPLERLHAHPGNANRMDPETFEKLRENMRREGKYPPVIVRPHPQKPGEFQILDGHNRSEVERQNSAASVLCYVWDCDDRAALLLLSTLNRLHGEDIPMKRAELLAELNSLVSIDEMALLLPEDEAAITDMLGLLDLDVDSLLAELERAASSSGTGLRSVTFAVSADEEMLVEEAIAKARGGMSGKNRRGAALVAICEAYLEASDA
jgi:ParB family transcriptional regulator, chromosome partitioning protein